MITKRLGITTGVLDVDLMVSPTNLKFPLAPSGD